MVATDRMWGELDIMTFGFGQRAGQIVQMAYVVQRMRPANGQSSDVSIPPRPLNAMLAAVIASERRLLPFVRFPAGVSCILVGRKP